MLPKSGFIDSLKPSAIDISFSQQEKNIEPKSCLHSCTDFKHWTVCPLPIWKISILWRDLWMLQPQTEPVLLTKAIATGQLAQLAIYCETSTNCISTYNPFCTTITQYSYPQIDMHQPSDLFQRSFSSKRNNRYLQRSTPMWPLLSQDISCHYDNIYMVCRITYKGLHRILWLFRWKKLWHRGAS